MRVVVEEVVYSGDFNRLENAQSRHYKVCLH